MPLQSRLFAGDAKLEAAAVSDPAHIVPGSSGEHVRKIQLALIQLDGAVLVPDGQYGPTTAAAVLAYKQKRAIINFSYQTQADNIVGKMTMAALDRELVEAENLFTGPVRMEPVYPVQHRSVAGFVPARPAAFVPVLGEIDPGVLDFFRKTQLRITPDSLEVPPSQTGIFRVHNAVGREVEVSNTGIATIAPP